MDSPNNFPHKWIDQSSDLDENEKNLAGRLRSLAEETNLQPKFKQALHSELAQIARQKLDRPAEKPRLWQIPGWAISAAAMVGLLLLLAAALLTLPKNQPLPAAVITPTDVIETQTPTPIAETPTPAPVVQSPVLQQYGLLMPPDQQTCERWREFLGDMFGARAEQRLAPMPVRSGLEFDEQEGMGCLIEVPFEGAVYPSLEDLLDMPASLLIDYSGVTEQGERLEPEPFDPILYGDWFGSVRSYENEQLSAQLSASWIPDLGHPCRTQPDTDCEVPPENRVNHVRLLLADRSLQNFFVALAHDDPAALDGLTPELRQNFTDLAALKQATGMEELMYPDTLQLGSVFGWFDDGDRTASLEVRLRDLLSSRIQPFSRLTLDVVYQDGRWRIANFTRLENEIPEPEATPTPLPLPEVPPAFDPGGIEPVSYASVDGRWLAEVWTVFPHQLAADQAKVGFNFLRVVVRASDGSTKFTVLEQWEPEGLGAPQPSEFHWAGDTLFFTWKSIPDGCGGFGFDYQIYRVDLQTGETEQIEFPHEGDLTVSPDGALAAYLNEGELGVYDLGTRETVASFPLPPGLGFETPYQAIGGMVWSPDQRQILLSTWSSWCGPADGRTKVWLLDLETGEWIEIIPAGDVNYRVTDWPEPDRVELEDQDRQLWTLDPTTGVVSRIE